MFSLSIASTLFFVASVLALSSADRSILCNTAHYKQLGGIEAQLEEANSKLVSD